MLCAPAKVTRAGAWMHACTGTHSSGRHAGTLFALENTQLCRPCMFHTLYNDAFNDDRTVLCAKIMPELSYNDAISMLCPAHTDFQNLGAEHPFLIH